MGNIKIVGEKDMSKKNMVTKITPQGEFDVEIQKLEKGDNFRIINSKSETPEGNPIIFVAADNGELGVDNIQTVLI